MFLSRLIVSLAIAVSTPFVSCNPVLSRRSALRPSVSGNVVPLSPSGGGTYPRLLTLHDGSILAAFTAFSGTTKTLTVTRSTNGGSSFSAWGVIASGTGDLDNTVLTQLSSGTVLAAFRNHDLNSSGQYTYYRITVCSSTNNGAAWTYLSQADQRAASGVNGFWEPFFRIAQSGALQIYYAEENAANDQDIWMRSSTNSGASWSGVTVVSGGTTTGRDGMPGCTNFNDGANKVLCVFETTEGAGTFTIKSVVSANDGSTWGGRSLVYAPTGTNNGANAPYAVTTTTGALVVSFMTSEDTGDANETGDDMKIITSQSTTPQSWGNKVTVTPVASYWPSLLAKSDGTVLGCSDNGGAKCVSISFSN